MERIELDYTNTLAEAVGPEHGLSLAELEALAQPSRRALEALQARRASDLRWMDLPYEGNQVEEICDFASSVRGRFDDVVVLGIGGSALGNRAVHTALSSPFHELRPPEGLPRLFVLDNVDPDLIGEFLDHLDPARCLFNVISKSGTTAETMAQFLIFERQLVERLGESAAREHVVVTTDREQGVLRPIVRERGYVSFDVPEGVGGRFSVLSPVGLLSSALVGVDVQGLLAGAADMDQRCRAADLFENPAQVHAALQTLLHHKKHKPIAVTFAYAHRLRDLGDWYAQLLAESIGKRRSRGGRVVHAGPTPVRAVGVTDQHSQVQLYVEGPFDKWFTFLAVEQADHAVEIPPGFEGREALDYLGGRTLGELFAAEREGTRVALTEAGRPNATITFPKVHAHTIGQFFYLMEMSVALMGEHYDVDAFDQPGVEAGKLAAYALMGRAGHEARRAEIEARRPATRRSV